MGTLRGNQPYNFVDMVYIVSDNTEVPWLLMKNRAEALNQFLQLQILFFQICVGHMQAW